MLDQLEQRRRRRTAECLSDFQVDTLLSSSSDAFESERWQAHTNECQECAKRLQAMREHKERFAAELPLAAISAATLERLERRTSSWWSWQRLVPTVAGMVAAAAALVLVLRPVGDDEIPVRLKGAPSFSVYVKRGEVVFEGDRGGTYLPGDRLQFSYSAHEPQYVAVLDIESTGRVTVFVPSSGASPVRVSKGREKMLPGSIELDDSLGQEQLLAVFCPSAFDLEAVMKKLASTNAAERAPRDSSELGLDPTCTISSFSINKARRNE